jgi:hypothetical protein
MNIIYICIYIIFAFYMQNWYNIYKANAQKINGGGEKDEKDERKEYESYQWW